MVGAGIPDIGTDPNRIFDVDRSANGCASILD
jgi:hypothetical protein